MSIIDRFRALLGQKSDPVEANNQAVLRELEAIRAAYDAAKVDREWISVGESGNAEAVNSPDRERLMLRVRGLERNSDLVNAIVGAYCRNVIGTGLKPQAKIAKADGTFNDKLNRKVEEVWEKWANTTACDISQTQTFSEIQEMAIARKLVDGEILVNKAMVSDRRIPLALQLLEADDIDSGAYGKKGETVKNGVVIDKYWKPLAYYIKVDDGTDTLQSSVKIPADRVIHLFKKTRPKQLRGVSEFAPIAKRIREIGEYEDAEVIGAKIRALISMIIVTPEPGQFRQSPNSASAMPNVTDVNGKSVKYLERGALQFLTPGSDIKTVGGQGAASNVRDFVQLESRQAAAGMGLSYESVTRDMSQSTYSSARQGNLDDRRTYQAVQQYLIRHLCMPIWAEWLDAAVLAGEVSIPNYWQNRDTYVNAVEWVAPGWPWIDPSKDVSSSMMEIRSGMTTLAQVCAEQGKDWQDVLAQLKREQEYAAELGITLDFSSAGAGGGGDGGDTEGTENKQGQAASA